MYCHVDIHSFITFNGLLATSEEFYIADERTAKRTSRKPGCLENSAHCSQACIVSVQLPNSFTLAYFFVPVMYVHFACKYVLPFKVSRFSARL